MCAGVLNATVDDLKETFAFLDDWEDRYAYIIELGKMLPNMDENLKSAGSLVRGCTSRVWIVTSEVKTESGDVRLNVIADSDAQIVRGLICILTLLYSGKSKSEIQAVDAEGFLRELGLDQHLSPSRRNGLFSMVERIRALAA